MIMDNLIQNEIIKFSKEMIIKFSNEMVAKMNTFAQVHYNTPHFDLIPKISFGESRTHSWGGARHGKPFISLSCKRYLNAAKSYSNMDFIEYSSIKGNHFIGELKNVSWQYALAALIAHEMAHAIQHYPDSKENVKVKFGWSDMDSRNVLFKGHDVFWQKIYKDLRCEFVNGKEQELIQLSENLKAQTQPAQEVAVAEIPVKEAPKRKNSRAWTSVVSNKFGGQFVHYYHSDGTLIGILFYRVNGNVFVYHPDTSTYEDTGTTKYSEARKKYFNI